MANADERKGLIGFDIFLVEMKATQSWNNSVKKVSNQITANEKIVTGAMQDIDAEYEALCAEVLIAA